MARTIHADAERSRRPTGRASRDLFTGTPHSDEDGYLWVLAATTTSSKVSGHRLSGVRDQSCWSRTKCLRLLFVAAPHEIKGEASTAS